MNDREIYEKIQGIEMRPIHEYVESIVLGSNNFTLRFASFSVLDTNPIIRRTVQDLIRYIAIKKGLTEELLELNKMLKSGVLEQIGVDRNQKLKTIKSIDIIRSILYFVLYFSISMFITNTVTSPWHLLPSANEMGFSVTVQNKTDVLTNITKALETTGVYRTTNGRIESDFISSVLDLRKNLVDFQESGSTTELSRIFLSSLNPYRNNEALKLGFSLSAAKTIIQIQAEPSMLLRGKIVERTALYNIIKDDNLKGVFVNKLEEISLFSYRKRLQEEEEKIGRRLTKSQEENFRKRITQPKFDIMNNIENNFKKKMSVSIEEYLSNPDLWNKAYDDVYIKGMRDFMLELTTTTSTLEQEFAGFITVDSDRLNVLTELSIELFDGLVVNDIKTSESFKETTDALIQGMALVDDLYILEKTPEFKKAVESGSDPELLKQQQLIAKKRQQLFLKNVNEAEKMNQVNVQGYNFLESMEDDIKYINGTIDLEKQLESTNGLDMFWKIWLNRISVIRELRIPSVGSIELFSRPNIKEDLHHSTQLSFGYLNAISKSTIKMDLIFIPTLILTRKLLSGSLYSCFNSATNSPIYHDSFMEDFLFNTALFLRPSTIGNLFSYYLALTPLSSDTRIWNVSEVITSKGFLNNIFPNRIVPIWLSMSLIIELLGIGLYPFVLASGFKFFTSGGYEWIPFFFGMKNTTNVLTSEVNKVKKMLFPAVHNGVRKSTIDNLTFGQSVYLWSNRIISSAANHIFLLISLNDVITKDGKSFLEPKNLQDFVSKMFNAVDFNSLNNNLTIQDGVIVTAVILTMVKIVQNMKNKGKIEKPTKDDIPIVQRRSGRIRYTNTEFENKPENIRDEELYRFSKQLRGYDSIPSSNIIKRR